MLRKMAARIAFMLAFLLLTISAAHSQGRVDGQVMDMTGKPYADVTLLFKSDATGQSYTIKTGKDGKYVQLGVTAGLYVVKIVDKGATIYTQQFMVKDGVENTLDMNLKEIAASQAAAHPEEVKKKEDAEDKFKELKEQFAIGQAALADGNDVKKQLKAATADQKAALQAKLDTDAQTAITAFAKAEQDASEKDVNNHATILTTLARAYSLGGKFDEATAAYQKSIDLKPAGAVYAEMSLSEANSAVALTDPKDMQAKLAEAEANCDKGIALDATVAALCWKNIGIILSNTVHMPEAIVPLQKASQADAKDAQTWFLLGNALSNAISTKQEGEKITYTIPPGTTDAYQKCIDAAPTGPYATQCKANIDGLAQLSSGEETEVSKKKKKN
jgi:tetratricopeptide (TPR) repeat protein